MQINNNSSCMNNKQSSLIPSIKFVAKKKGENSLVAGGHPQFSINPLRAPQFPHVSTHMPPPAGAPPDRPHHHRRRVNSHAFASRHLNLVARARAHGSWGFFLFRCCSRVSFCPRLCLRPWKMKKRGGHADKGHHIDLSLFL